MSSESDLLLKMSRSIAVSTFFITPNWPRLRAAGSRPPELYGTLADGSAAFVICGGWRFFKAHPNLVVLVVTLLGAIPLLKSEESYVLFSWGYTSRTEALEPL